MRSVCHRPLFIFTAFYRGYRHMGAKSLGARHVKALVEYWLTKSSKTTNKLISPGAIKNRMATLRCWARKINKPGVIPKDNRTLGIPNRQGLPSHNKVFKLTDYQIKYFFHNTFCIYGHCRKYMGHCGQPWG